MSPERHGGDRGFTLLEMLVALTVLGIVLATLFRLAGDSLVQYTSRERQLLLALTAEAAFNAERLAPGGAAATAWPEGLRVSAERRQLDAAANQLEGLGDTSGALGAGLDWLVVRASDPSDRTFTLEGAVPKPGPAASPTATEPSFIEPGLVE